MIKRALATTILGLGLLLVVWLPFGQSNAASRLQAPLEPAWEKMGSTLALVLMAGEEQVAFSPHTALGRIQAVVREAQAIQVSIRFKRELRADAVAALEQGLGLHFHRLNGKLAHVGAIYGLSVPLSRMAALSREPDVVQIELLDRPVARPLDVSLPLVGADQVWATQDWAGQSIQGKGIRIANFDTGVDVYHPDFWHADGGTYTWLDNDGGGFTDSGGECVDLNTNAACDFPGETLRYFDAGGTAGIGASGVLEANVDWLYNDANGNGQRDYGPTASYTETQPTYGELIFLADDGNLNNTLDPGENLIALGTSKVCATLNCGAVTRSRGVDLYLSDNDTVGHGTGVAGVLLGGNIVNISGSHTVPNRRFIGVAPAAELLAAHVGCWSNPIPETTYIPWAADNGADVMLYEFGMWWGEFLDGSSNLEQMIDTQAANGIVQVVPAGNLAGSSKEDTETVPAGGSHVFTANMPPLTLHSWAFTAFLWRNPSIDVTYTLTTPFGSSVTLPATTGSAWGLTTIGSDTIWHRRLDSSRGTAKYDIWIQASGGVANGNWLIRADNPSATPLTLFAYVADSAYQWYGGMVWVNPNETRTVCWPATADSAVTVGSYSTRAGFDTVSLGDLSSFSSRGSRVDGVRVLDVAAPGGQLEVIAAESRSSGTSAVGKYQWFGGTSAAGPHVAGTAALMLQKNPTLVPTQVASILHATAITDTWTEAAAYGGSTPNDSWGWGKLDAASAVANTPTPTDFSLLITPTRQQVAAGQATTYTVGLAALFGFSSPVTLSVDGLPSAAVATWSLNPITPGVTNSLSLTTALATPPGDHTLLITGTGGGVTHTAQSTLTVLAPFLSIGKSASANPIAGAPLTYTIHVSNTGNVTATAVVITDAVPVGANYVSGGTHAGGVVTWSGLIVRADEAVQAAFVVTACQAMTNSFYRVVTSSQGVTTGWGAPLAVTPAAPTIETAFNHTPSDVSIGQPVYFTDTTTTDGGAIVAWRWDFGDGDRGYGRTIGHSYTAIGSYTVTLTVTDTCGYARVLPVPGAVRVRNRLFLPLTLRGHP